MSNEINWQEALDKALTVPGHLGNAYNRFYEYSFLNQILLLTQGVEPQPVATYKRWQAIGRQVIKGAKARTIIRPINIDVKNDQGEVEKRITRFKPVRCVFPYEDTTGDELPETSIPEWSLEQAEKTLQVTRVPFRSLDGNAGGYSFDRMYAINPVAPHPTKTIFHELSHIVSGHTVPEKQTEYLLHRGLFEFEAEGAAYLTANELGQLDADSASESRAYIQHWLDGNKPPESSIRQVFKTTDTIIRAGRIAVQQTLFEEEL